MYILYYDVLNNTASPHFIPDVILRLMLLIRLFVYVINVNMAGHKSWNAYFSKRCVFRIFKCGSI